LLTKSQPDPTVDKATEVIGKFSFLKKCCCRQLLKDANSQIEVLQVMNLLTKSQPDSTVYEASTAIGSCWMELPLFTVLSFSFLFLSLW